MIKFEVGKIYTGKRAFPYQGDRSLFKVVRRTEHNIWTEWVSNSIDQVYRAKITKMDDSEHATPLGMFRGCPIIVATRTHN